MNLALATGIPVRAWLAEDMRTVVTAIALLEEQEKAARNGGKKRSPGAGGPNSPQYSG